MTEQEKAYHAALSQCAELLDNMKDGDPITDTPKYLAAKLNAQSVQVPAAEVRAQALEEAAKLIDTKVYNYQDECGSYDHSTGVTEYPGNGAEWICEMQELAEEIRSLAQSSTADKTSEVRAVDLKQLAKWWSMRGSVITAAINQEPVRFPVEDLSELLNVFDAALPAAPSTADSGNTSALGEGAGDAA